jgi:HPt (histidine-containing phosphotransfer) domain-containing protein
VSVGAGGEALDPMGRAEAAFRRIAEQARHTNLQRIEELSRLASVAASGSLSEHEGAAAADTAHQLVGSAGTFGFEQVSQLARRVEGYFVKRQFSDASSAAASSWLELMHEELEKGQSDSDDWD